jgi:2-C-methyl-D-erythritol 4-phosphate cytidylyltransferase
MLAEASGFKVKLVECGDSNIKITFPEDFERVRHIINSEEDPAK